VAELAYVSPWVVGCISLFVDGLEDSYGLPFGTSHEVGTAGTVIRQFWFEPLFQSTIDLFYRTLQRIGTRSCAENADGGHDLRFVRNEICRRGLAVFGGELGLLLGPLF